jgi:hypothetical protein
MGPCLGTSLQTAFIAGSPGRKGKEQEEQGGSLCRKEDRGRNLSCAYAPLIVPIVLMLLDCPEASPVGL